MIRRPAAVMLALGVLALAGPRVVLAAPPASLPPTSAVGDQSPPAAMSPHPVASAAATTASSAPVLDRSTSTQPEPSRAAAQASPRGNQAGAPAPARSVGEPPASSAAQADPAATDVPTSLADVPRTPGGARDPAQAAPASPGLPEATALALVMLAVLAISCAAGLAVLGRRAVLVAPDDASILATATRRRLENAPILPWDDPVLASLGLNRPGSAEMRAGSLDPTDGAGAAQAGSVRPRRHVHRAAPPGDVEDRL
jgi:hypothetical protein